MSDSNSSVRSPADHVLVLRWDNSTVGPVERLFENAGFSVHSLVGNLIDVNSDEYGAIVHLARSSSELLMHLGDEQSSIRHEEWLLVEGDSEDDYHCMVQLTPHASFGLRQFVRWLWAQATIT